MATGGGRVEAGIGEHVGRERARGGGGKEGERVGEREREHMGRAAATAEIDKGPHLDGGRR